MLAYGFLHINLVHLTTNMLCLALWGGHLEKRVGSLYFLIIYASALVFGAVIGNAIHSTPYLTVGASGATSGILGALLCLWILGRSDLQANFFAINIGLNIAFALSNSRIDWGVHLGGFAAGLIACAILDLVEKINAHVLRSKFPEFVKTNIFALACACGLLLWSNAPAAAAGSEAWLPAAAFIVIWLLVVKMVDIVLSLKKGLAVIVIALAHRQCRYRPVWISPVRIVVVAGLRLASLARADPARRLHCCGLLECGIDHRNCRRLGTDVDASALLPRAFARPRGHRICRRFAASRTQAPPGTLI